MTNRCKDCVFWTRNTKSDSRFGECERIENDISNAYPRDKLDVPSDEVTVEDGDMYSACLNTGENFGCVHFKRTT